MGDHLLQQTTTCNGIDDRTSDINSERETNDL